MHAGASQRALEAQEQLWTDESEPRQPAPGSKARGLQDRTFLTQPCAIVSEVSTPCHMLCIPAANTTNRLAARLVMHPWAWGWLTLSAL